ncbi:MAG: TrmH family RNA methyltransferase [Actinomycetota bacterium]
MITSIRNPHVERARKLRKRGVRDKVRAFLVEGFTGLREALASGRPIEAVFAVEEARARVEEMLAAAGRHLRVFEVTPQVMRAISDATTPPGVIGITTFVDVPAHELLDSELDLAVTLADIRDPGNLGTMLRTAWAVGAGAVFLGEGTVDAYNPKVVRAAAGAVFHVPFARIVALPWLLRRLGERGLQRVGADPKASRAYDRLDLTVPSVLVFGNEAWGLPREVEEELDLTASIPMRGAADSLNVAIAAALFLFEASRQRRAPHGESRPSGRHQEEPWRT